MTQSEGKMLYDEQAICRDCFKSRSRNEANFASYDEQYYFSNICEICWKGFSDEECAANEKVMYPNWVDTCYRCANTHFTTEKVQKLRTRFYFSMRPCGSCSHEIQRYSISG